MHTPFDPSRRRYLKRIVGGGLLAASGRFAAADAPGAPQPVLMWGKQGTAPGEFNAPISLAFNAQDELYVTDVLNQRIQVFKTDGTFVRMFSMAVRPASVAVDRDGLVYVSNWNQHQITVHTPTGQQVRAWGSKGTAPGEFRQPGGQAFGPDGTLYVADQANARIQQFTPTGTLVRAWGTLGSGPGEFGGGWEPGTRFAGPQFLAVDRRGRVYATDTATFRVQRFSATGEFQLQWCNASGGQGGFGPMRGTLSGPMAVGVDRQDRVWVGAANHHVQQFSADGRFLQALGSGEPDGVPGHFHFPHGIVCDSQGFLYVADALNYRIQKFAITG